jgi:phospholipase C
MPANRRQILKSSAGAMAAAVLGHSRRSLGQISAPASIADIEHVIFLMQENRSFDHYFGTYRGVRGFADRSVTQPDGSSVFAQKFDQTKAPGVADPLMPFHLDTATTPAECTHDIHHQWVIQHDCWNGGAMDRWVATHLADDGAQDLAGTPAGPLTMGYYTRGDLPFYYALADAFTICDAYFGSSISGTLANRLYAMSGTLDPDGKNGGPVLNTPESSNQQDYLKLYAQLTWETMPERLEAAGVTWRVYGPQDTSAPILNDNVLVYFKNYYSNPSLALNGFGFQNFPVDFQLACQTGTLPQVSWVITPFLDSEHPPTPLDWGQDAVHQVLAALFANPDLWKKTVLFITWDENGGFFDHVPPPVAPAGTAGEFLTVDDATLAAVGAGKWKGPIGLGFRVPMLIVSPFSRGGFVCSDVFDHTSMLRFLEARFGVEAPNLSAWRRNTVGDLTSAFNFASPDFSIPTLPPTSLAGPLTRPECLTAITTEPGPTSTVTYPLPASNQPAPQQEPGTAQRPSGLVRSEISGGGGCAIERRPQRLPAWPVFAAAALLALRRRRRP